MTNEERILELAQSIYQAKNNRVNDVDAGSETDDFIASTVDWVNQFLPELEAEADWNYVRENDLSLATITEAGTSSITLPTTVQRLVSSPYRSVTISHDGAIVATFTLVNPNQITNVNDPSTENRCTVLGPRGARKLVFSRPFTENEVGGIVSADVINYIHRLSTDDVSVLDIVEPLQLIILGVAKNSTLPDIVQGGISPALAQKYADLLSKSVQANNATAGCYDSLGEDLSYIRGVW